VAAAAATGRADASAFVEQPGGIVHILVGRTGYMTGPAEVMDEGSDA
jgi:diaminopimelate epimerase